MKRKIVCDYFQRGIATRISLEQKTIINETIKTLCRSKCTTILKNLERINEVLNFS